MPELNPLDLESFTKGRLPKNDFETQRVLNAAQTLVRNNCQWHVSPVHASETFTLNGPGGWGGYGVGSGTLYSTSNYGSGLQRQRVGGHTLMLPTKRLQVIESIVEDGISLDVSTLQYDEIGNVTKASRSPWSTNMRGIVVTITHGWSETEAADWRQIVLMIADRMSLVRGLVGPFDLAVGPYRTGATSEPFKDLLDQIDTARYMRMSI